MYIHYLVKSKVDSKLYLQKLRTGEMKYTQKGTKYRDMSIAFSLAEKHDGTVILVEPEMMYE